MVFDALIRPSAIVVALCAGLAACAPDPYQIGAVTTPPWESAPSPELPSAEPPLGPRAHRISLCYGKLVNDPQEVLDEADYLCKGGRLIVEHQNTFWNGCGLLQPVRVTYICDPPPSPPSRSD